MEAEDNYFSGIETERLVLREINESDIDFVFTHFSNEDVCRYLYDEEPLTSREEAEQIIEWYKNPRGKNHNRWIILNKESKESMGTCGYHRWDKKNKTAEIGYDLGKDFWGKGYMKEALIYIIKRGFSVMDLNRIQAFISIDNARSYKLLESIGFTREGVIRDKHLFRGRYYDHYCYSLLKRDFM